MKSITRKRKKAIHGMKIAYGNQELTNQLYAVLAQGKAGFDSYVKELGKMMAETIMYIEREEVAGPDYQPRSADIQKWASQAGSVYIGDQKIRLHHPRLRGPQGEIELKSYKKLKSPDGFSEELLGKVMHGLSCRKYNETVLEAAQAFGVSAGTVSRHIVATTAKELKAFKERSLESFTPFAVFLDTIHRGKEAFIVALGINLSGEKQALGFWQGATECSEICSELLADLERRGLVLSRRILWITDGGKGVIKTLKDRFGKKVIHQRCTIHKGRNIQKHLSKKYRKEAGFKFRTALEQNDYKEAKGMLEKLESWLRRINESAADSLLEAMEEILTLHRLKIPALLRKSLHSTNAIESMFSTVRDIEGNIKRYRNSRMMQRWLGSVLLYCEKGFRRVKGYESIAQAVENIEADLGEKLELKEAA